MSKRFDLDIAKRQIRAKLRRFVQPRIFDRKHRKVLCFPGAHGLEIDQIYRKIGIRDENIIGVERDPDNAKIIRRNYPRITVYQGELIDFVYEYDGAPFDIVSLDFCGCFGVDKIRPLSLLFAKNLVSDRAIIATNFLAGRESPEYQDMLRHSYINVATQRSDIIGAPMTTDRAVKELERIAALSRDETLGVIRDDVITHWLVQIPSIMIPQLVIAWNYDLTHVKNYGLIVSKDFKITEERKENGHHLLCAEGLKVADDKDIFSKPSIIKHEAIQSVNEILFKYGIVESIAKDIRYHIGRTLVMAFYDTNGYPWLPSSMERYSYVSDTNQRMLTDFIEMRRFREYLDKIPDGIMIQRKPDSTEHRFFPVLKEGISPYDNFDILIRTVIKPYAKLEEKLFKLSENWPDRIDIGGGKSIPFDEEKMKQQIIARLKKGHSVEDVAKKYPTYGLGRIRAIKAHITMGTY
jgi:hypothetical protein